MAEDETHLIAITDINIGKRIRKEYGDMDKLEASLLRHKQIVPIVIDQDNTLIDGGRRVRAAMHLGWTHLEYVRKEALDEITQRELELETCIQRKELEWPEEVLAIETLYKLKQEKYGRAKQGTAEGFGLEEASELLERSVGSISMDLALARALREFPDIAFEKGKVAALKRYRREREKKIRQEIAARERRDPTNIIVDGETSTPPQTQEENTDLRAGETPPPAKPLYKKVGFKGYGLLYHGDSTQVLRSWPAAIADCLVTDPPYGLALFKAGATTSGRRLAEHEGGMYDDDPKRLLDVLDKVFREAARILKPQAHAYVFFHHNWYEDLYQLLCRHFGDDAVMQTPNIWIKNTPGIGDPNERWVPAYEPFFFVNRGRPMVKPQAFNWIKYDTVGKQSKIHPTEKPTLLLRHIIEASCVGKELVMDPFAGSCSTLVAAVEMGCRFYGCEMDEAFYEKGKDRLATTIGLQQEADEKVKEGMNGSAQEGEDSTDTGVDG